MAKPGGPLLPPPNPAPTVAGVSVVVSTSGSGFNNHNSVGGGRKSMIANNNNMSTTAGGPMISIGDSIPWWEQFYQIQDEYLPLVSSSSCEAAVTSSLISSALLNNLPALPTVTAVAVSLQQRILVVAYEDGTVILFPYPCMERISASTERLLCRVTSYVSRMFFAADQRTIILLDAGSRMIIQTQIFIEEA
jgi:hypothetical protein